MSTRFEIVEELRSLFKEGATPSRLIRHIAERHEGDSNLHSLIQMYFQEAFAVPIVRGLNPIDDYHCADLRYAFLSEQLLHEMIQNRCLWDRPNGDNSFETPGWLESVQANDPQRQIDQIQMETIPELSRCWHQLNEKESAFIRRSLASANGLYETVIILSRLAECLQQKLLEAEAKC
jgi:hypothetical protein